MPKHDEYVRALELHPNFNKDNYKRRKMKNPNYNKDRHLKQLELHGRDYSGKHFINFRFHSINIGFNIRTDYCIGCNKMIDTNDGQRTHLHHFLYDWNDPIANTIEVCVSCHRHIHLDNHDIPEINKPLTELDMIDWKKVDWIKFYSRLNHK